MYPLYVALRIVWIGWRLLTLAFRVGGIVLVLLVVAGVAALAWFGLTSS